MQTGEKIKYNFVLGIASEVLTIVLGILVPRLVLTNYGSEINGLLNSVTQVYSYVALLEAGVGTATIQALYRTVGCENKSETNAVLSATNKYYHRTGILYLLVILLFSASYPLIVNTEIPTFTIILVIIFNGLGSVINYFFQAKYFLLLQAEGKNYIKTSLTMFTNVFKNVAKIVLMACGFDVVFVQMIAMFISIIQMLYITWYIKRYYNWIDLSVKPNFEAISQSKNVLVHQISGLIFNNTDTIVLTVACGLKTVSVYAMYNLFYGMINTLQTTLSGSVVFWLGQTYHTDKRKFIKLYDCYELYYVTLVFIMYSITNFFILPFMKLYTSGVTDINYINYYLPQLFSMVSLMSCARNAPNNVISFEGHFKQTQGRSVIEAMINLTVSVVAVKFWGIYGVLIGTLIAIFYRSNDIIIYANRKILKRSVWKTYKRWIVNFLIYVFIVFSNQWWNIDLNSYQSILIWVIPYSLYTAVIFLVISSLLDYETAKCAIDIMCSYFRKSKKG